MLRDRIVTRAGEFSGEFGMFAKNLATAESVGINEDALMPTASVIKVCVLGELYRQAEAGLVDLHSRREVTADDWWGGSGVLKEFAPGLQPTVTDLARMMIVVSDNTATNLILDLITADRVNEFLEKQGFQATRSMRKVRGDGTRLKEATGWSKAGLLEENKRFGLGSSSSRETAPSALSRSVRPRVRSASSARARCAWRSACSTETSRATSTVPASTTWPGVSRTCRTVPGSSFRKVTERSARTVPIAVAEPR